MALVPAAARLLVPAPPPPLAAGFDTVDLPLVNGLPETVPLGAVATALLIAPTGLVRAWRDADPALPVDRGDDQAAPLDDGAPAPPAGARPPFRLLVRRLDGVLIGAVPLVARSPAALPLAADDGGPAIELVVLRWDIRAGNLRGPGDVGGRIAVAWRRTDRAPDRFAPPPIHPAVAARGRLDPPAAPAAPPVAAPPAVGLLRQRPFIGYLERFESEIGAVERLSRRRLFRGYAP
jgi:hypothetical protein